jgi:hypothetical protein
MIHVFALWDTLYPLETKGLKTMTKFVSNASIRRFIALQQRKHPEAPPRLWQRWRLFIECSCEPVTFNEWLER